ncbi:MAG: tRNA lysidine(34) synthetase TilS [Flavobacteriaceae bacterium]|nr:tRNA lysidine(34) synthetase TilS [Flavobacteriaceae bacterium]
MENLFLNHLKKNFPSISASKLIIAVSGGVDSIVLFHLCLKLKLNFFVAHCNFKLRKKESDLDEKFVRDLAIKHNIKFYTKSFNTKKLSNNDNKSIQMVARELRYSWFEELSKELNIKHILTAHHLDDSLETFLINLSRGSGIDGLLGIPKVNDTVYRPLLIFKKDEILSYAKENKITWREDSSNKKREYLRNQIRLEVIPKLKEINPNLLDNFSKSIDRLQQSKSIIKDKMDDFIKNVSFTRDEKIYFEINNIKKVSNIDAYLYELLKKYNFTQWDDIRDLLDSQSGKQIISKTHKLLKDREYLILAKNSEVENKSLLINKSSKEVAVSVGKIKVSIAKKISKEDSDVIYLDSAKLDFPLRVRNVLSGDYFYPFGMNGKKKVSKYLKDKKISVFDKDKVLILETSKNKIIWVVGMRLDDRFSVTDNTKEITKIELIR